jgi:hypothetical protein
METMMEETKPTPPDQAAAKPTPLSTEKGKFCACERDHGEDDVASLPRLLVKDQKTVDGKTVRFERPERFGACSEHGAGEEKFGFKRTAEHWAAFRGHHPQVTREEAPAEKPLKVMPAIHNPKFRHYQEARFLVWGGVVGKEMTLEEYDAGVNAALAHVYR